MKKRWSSISLILFCSGAVIGLAVPRWLIYYNCWNGEGFSTGIFQKYIRIEPDYIRLLLEMIRKRMLWMLLFYFASYSAAGVWMMSAFCLIAGSLLGWMCAGFAIHTGLDGVVFLLCGLSPHFIFYTMAFAKIIDLMERRRERIRLRCENAAASAQRYMVYGFLEIFFLTCAGIASETWINPRLMRMFLK